MFPQVNPFQWTNSNVIAQASGALLQTVLAQWPAAFELLATDPLEALGYIDDLNVVTDPTVRHKSCPIDGTYDPETLTITYRETGSPKRDNFTLLHELGHHLLATSETWCFDIAPALASAGKERTVEELLVSTFASRTLIPDTLTSEVFTRGVTSTAVTQLADRTQASATACLVRALAEPGERLVMLTNLEGIPWFVQTTGTPYAPSARVRQPAIEAAARRALEGTGSFRLNGGEGLRFGTGNVNPHVTFDVTVSGGLAYAIIETTRPDSRLKADRDGWQLDCLAGCGHTFTANDAPTTCTTCNEATCPRCRGCECRKPTCCDRCTLALPTARARSGNTICEDCE